MEETVALKKPHACGGKEWRVVKTGADVKLQCLACGRFITLSRDEFAKRRTKKGAEVCNEI